MNVLQLSDDVLTFGSREVKLSGGQTASVGEVAWLQFESLWNRILSIFLSFDGDTDDEQALIKELGKAPDLIVDLIHFSTGIQKADIGKMRKGDVFTLATESVRVNFIQNKEHLDFFGVFKELNLGGASEEPEAAEEVEPES